MTNSTTSTRKCSFAEAEKAADEKGLLPVLLKNLMTSLVVRHVSLRPRQSNLEIVALDELF